MKLGILFGLNYSSFRVTSDIQSFWFLYIFASEPQEQHELLHMTNIAADFLKILDLEPVLSLLGTNF